MANKSKSAKKRIRQDINRRLRNRSVMSNLKTHVKAYKKSVTEDGSNKKDLLRKVESLFRKASSKGIIHKRNASRNISKLSKLS
ncbi:MAG: 30S ribosomal protein S20 [Thermodesulfobacteriota bacterium]|nr:30S ribosomal protein S20 [Thermodesulfobacteriota bacterium]